MGRIKKIRIASASGYVIPEYVYRDTLTITENSISYRCHPAAESEVIPEREWTYKTNNPVFAKLFAELAETIPGVLTIDPGRGMLDVGYVSFVIMYDDGTRKEVSWQLPKFEFEECFRAAQEMVPQFEEMPRVLLL